MIAEMIINYYLILCGGRELYHHQPANNGVCPFGDFYEIWGMIKYRLVTKNSEDRMFL